jgi:hypothetical protein
MYILWPFEFEWRFGIFCGRLVYNFRILVYIFRILVYIFRILVYCTKKNLATLFMNELHMYACMYIYY